MKFLDWYLKIAIGAALVGGSMELFMIKTGFCVRTLLSASSLTTALGNVKMDTEEVKLEHKCNIAFVIGLKNDDKVTVLESEKRAWESSPEAQAIREGLNPWRNRDAETRRNS
ncbi:hypothetical protein WN944_025552 [Citrus x changshan-huyou]|uniref:Uncharacterized protein n=1 Tax=Citrus x changshan-huyou TaxID=2935761 RepID=A0AAP0LQ32_9ROSI